MSRQRGAVFQLRLSVAEAQRLEREAEEAGLSKADLIRKALGWDLTGRPTRTAPVSTAIAAAPTTKADPEKQPGLAAIQALQKRLGRKP